MIEKPIEIQALTAGPANQVLWLKGRTDSYIFKWLRHSQRFGLDRSAEFELQQQLAATGLAPDVIALDPAQWVLQRYVEGTPMNSFALGQTEKLKVTAQALALVHQQQPAWQGTTLWQKCDAYADKLGGAISSQLLQFKQALKSNRAQVLCHFDLAFAHILVNQKLTIVDWEYAGWGDRLTDIASSIEINQLDDPSADALCHYYRQYSDTVIDNHELNDHRLFVRWLNQQWTTLLNQE